MSNILVINASGQETRVALIENGIISEYYLERKNEKGILGNIYKGRVVRVLPGMQAAFVDIGLEKAAFLYVADIVSDPSFPGFSEEMEIQASSVDGDPLDAEDLAEPTEAGEGEAANDEQQQAAPAADIAPSAPSADPEAAPAVSAPIDTHVAEATAGVLASDEKPVDQEPPAPAPPVVSAPIVIDAAPPAAAESARATPDATLLAPPVHADVTPLVAAPPAEPAAAPSASGEEPIVELSPDDALEEGEAEEDDEPEDEGDAAHAAAEEALAEEEEGAAPGEGGAEAASAVEGAPLAAGRVGVPEDKSGSPRERRGRRRGGRGRRRGADGKPEVKGAEARSSAEPKARSEQKEPRRDGRSGGGGGGGENGHRKGGEKNGGFRQKAQIQDLLKEGDEVLVQVVKDPIGTKGARITCHISLPGRHLVFMPTVDHVGISRRIENEKERRRLRELVDQFRPPGTGFIVRTVAENEPREKLVADIKFLLGLWNEVGKKKELLKAPACLHPDLDLILRSIRDLFSDEVDKVVIDDRAEWERIKAFMEQVAPELATRVELFAGDEPIFDEYGVEQELLKAQNRKVWLKSGGYIIIDQTEALVAIDVNSGRYTGKKSLEETITKINCEAAKEIVYQLRLRNIGGIIIIDFIDMDKGQNRDKVFKTLQEALAADRAKTNVLKISDIGLVEMTRKRVRESVGRLTTESCVTCDGRGHIRSKATIAYEIMRECQRAAKKHREDQLVVGCHPEVAKIFSGPERDAMRLLMMKLNKSIVIRPQPQYHVEQYDLHGKWSRPELQGERGRPPVLGRREGQGGGGGRGRGGRDRDNEGGKRDGRDKDNDGGKREQPPAQVAGAEQKPPDAPAEKVST